jgi:hypothetical protein
MKKVDEIPDGEIDWDNMSYNGKKITRYSKKSRNVWISGIKFKVGGKTMNTKFREKQEQNREEDDLMVKEYVKAVEKGDYKKATDLWISMVSEAVEFQRKFPEKAYPKSPDWETRLLKKLSKRKMEEGIDEHH